MKNHLKNIDYPLFVIILLLASVGIVMVYSASFVFAGLDPDLNNPDFSSTVRNVFDFWIFRFWPHKPIQLP